MRLFDGHQVRDLDHAFVGMDDVQRGKRSLAATAKNTPLIGIKALFIARFSGIWIGFKSAEFLFYDALRFLQQ